MYIGSGANCPNVPEMSAVVKMENEPTSTTE